MERNTFLAIALSVMVLFGYEAIFVAPKRAETLKQQKLTQNKEVTEKITAPLLPNTELLVKPTNNIVSEKMSVISSTGSDLILSNVGGSLHKVEFLHEKTAEKQPVKNISYPLTNMFTLEGIEGAVFDLSATDDKSATYQYADNQRKVVTQYNHTSANTMEVSIKVSNLTQVSILANPLRVYSIDSSSLDTSNNRETMLDEYAYYVDAKVTRKGNAAKFSPKETKTVQGQVKWVLFRDHYHAFIAKPLFDTKAIDIKQLSEKSLDMFVMPAKEQIEPRGQAEYKFLVYAGNQDINTIKGLGQDFNKAVAFSNFWIIDVIAHGIYYTVPAIQQVIKSWGISIILVSLLIYGVTYPLTFQSMMSMRKMQMVQPKISALKEKYKNDATRMNTELMDIYRREKINPLGGCLPFLLQMPVFFALYQVLWRSYYFQGKSFLWIKDLAAPDRAFILPFDLPILGHEVNILPMLMAGVMFAQQKISSKNTVITDETQAMQQKMMLYFFPFFIGFIFYKFASSLSLYFTMFYLMSTITQWNMNKKVPVIK